MRCAAQARSDLGPPLTGRGIFQASGLWWLLRLSGRFAHLIMFTNTAAALSAVLAMTLHERRNQSDPAELKTNKQQTPSTNLNK